MSSSEKSAVQALDEAQQHNMFIAFWLGGLVYGLYVLLFVSSVKIEVKTRKLHRRFSARVFTFASLVIFILTTIYMGINASRFLYAFSPHWTEVSNGKLPIYYLRDFTTFRTFGPSIIMLLLIWLGDALAIYRCFIIWEANWWIILVPCLLLFHSIVNNTIINIWERNPATFTLEQVRLLIGMVFPINIAQSGLTTSLIAFKISRQHIISRSAGLNELSSGIGLLTIVRIIVESSMIFTVQQVIMCILFYIGSPAVFLFHGTLVSSIGITFVLLAIRVNEAQNAEKSTFRLPQLASGGPASTQFSSKETTSVGGGSNLRDRGGNRRRTVSEGMAFAPPSVSTSAHVCRCRRPMTDGDVDLEKGGMACAKSTPDAILAVNPSSSVG